MNFQQAFFDELEKIATSLAPPPQYGGMTTQPPTSTNPNNKSWLRNADAAVLKTTRKISKPIAQGLYKSTKLDKPK